LKKSLIRILLALFSGGLLVLVFPKFDWAPLAWLALVPLLLAIADARPRESMLLSLLCGAVFFPGVFYWILKIPDYTLFNHSLLGVYLGSYLACFGLLFTWIARRSGITIALCAAPFLWVCLEFARSNLAFLALPWGLLAHSQYRYTDLIQMAGITGAYGISFMVVLVNAAVTGVLLSLKARTRVTTNAAQRSPTVKAAAMYIMISGAMVGIAWGYGNWVVKQPLQANKIKLALVQGNIPQAMKWDPKAADFIMSTHVDLSRQATAEKPMLVVWPEAATPGFVLKRLDLMNQIGALINDTQTYYLIGSTEYPKFSKDPFDPKKGGNTALFFSPQGKVLSQYIKMRLVPFKEYIPYEGTIKWPGFIVPEDLQTFQVQGQEFTLCDLEGSKFGVVICWESLFPGIARQFKRDGAHFLINITSEAWFGETAFPHQFLAITVFRAVENRVTIARAANTGVTGIIDPYGRVTERLLVDGRDIFVRGYLVGDVPMAGTTTMYTRYGNIFVWLCLAVSGLVMFRAAIIRPPR
jgi:apolipoprotein N-acyltransferase